MRKAIKNLGKTLSKEQKLTINGGGVVLCNEWAGCPRHGTYCLPLGNSCRVLS